MNYTADNLPSAEKLREVLAREVLEVVFKKKNGETRLMFCTLMPQYLPDRHNNNLVDYEKPSDEVITVWDLESDAWRSFRLDSVVSVDHD